MMKKNGLSFMIELLIMLVIFIILINVSVVVYASARNTSQKARHLSDAVILASNGAEVFIASEDENEIIRILNQNDNHKNNDALEFSYNDDLEPQADGRMVMKIDRTENDGFVHGKITIFYGNEVIYELETGRAQKGGRQ